MRAVEIILLCTLAAIAYGIVHDEITAHRCVEYFTVGHPPVFGDTTDPTLLGLGWGVIATWWVGAGLGVLVAISARTGARPRWTARRLVRPLGALLIGVGCAALIAGVCGHVAATRGWVRLDADLEYWIRRPETRIAFLTNLWTHLASYLGGAVGGICLCGWIWRRRGIEARREG